MSPTRPLPLDVVLTRSLPRRGETAGQGIARRKVMGSGVSLTMMTDSLHSRNSNPRKKASPHAAPSSRSAAAPHDNGLRSGRHRSLLARMPKPKPRKTLRPRGGTRVKGFASRGLGKKWILILLVVLLLIPAMQVAVVRFINPPLTLPMLIEQGSAMFSSAPKCPLRYRWIALPQIPEMFLEHLWILEDPRKKLRFTRSDHFTLRTCSMCTCYGRRATPGFTSVSRRT